MDREPKAPVPEGKGTACRKSADHSGHRSRMLNRYRTDGLPGFREHEVLEMLLFRAIPQSNTNPMAHELLTKYGSLETVLEQAEVQVVSGAGEKTIEMLRNTRDAVEACFRHVLMASARLDRAQFFTAAVWYLRRYPERILLVVCDPAGKPEEIGTIGNAEPAEILENLRSVVQPDMLCHIACTGREEELARLRKCRTGVRTGMLLSLSERWVPVWK